MNLYRFSPITSQDQLLAAIAHIHRACYQLCLQSFGHTLPNAGNMGVFTHYDDEYERLTAIRQQLCEPSDNPGQKYFPLHEPSTIPADGDIPAATYTHLYIRKPDPYRHHAGDVDFYVPQDEYDQLKASLASGTVIKGARIFPRADLDMIELYDPDIDALGYVSPRTMTEKVRIKLSDATNL